MHKRAARLQALVVLLLLGVALVTFGQGRALAETRPKRNVQVYVPIVHIRPMIADTDLLITHLGLYQSVQDNSNEVSLVAGKPSLLRVFARASSGQGAPPVAEVVVRGYRGDRLLGELRLGPRAVPAEPAAAELLSTFNFDVPADWLQGELRLTAAIDQANTVAETDEANNELAETFTFRDVPPLDLTIVPIRYRDVVNGVTYFEDNHDPLSDWLLSAYPVKSVNVRYHTPYDFVGDLRQAADWQRLLSELTTLWAAEVGFGSSETYLGLIPVNAQGAPSWFVGGYSGLGWIGQRVSVVVDFGTETGPLAGHEIGHNFGRLHAPCGNPSNVDPHYPYPDASIGVFGVDMAEDALLDPHQARDMMSYCGPEWVSDYTYEALFDDHLAKSSQVGTMEPRLLVRATLTEDGRAEFLPSYLLDQTVFPTETDGEYQLEVVNRGGQSVARVPAQLLQADEAGIAARLLVAAVSPTLLGDDFSMRLIRNGVVLASQLWSPSERAASHSLTLTAAPGSGGMTLSWGSPEVPALVRVSYDGGHTRHVIALDYVGGEITLDRELIGRAMPQVEVVLADGRSATTTVSE